MSRDLRLITSHGQDWPGTVVNNFQQQIRFKLMSRERKHCQLLSSLAKQNSCSLNNKENKLQLIKPSRKMLAFIEAQAEKQTSSKMNQSQFEFTSRESQEPMRLSQRNRTVLSCLQHSQREQSNSNHKPDQFKRVRAMQAQYEREKSQLIQTKRKQNRKRKHCLTLPDQLACSAISPVNSQNMQINAILARQQVLRQLQIYPKQTTARYNDIPITQFLYQTTQSHQDLQSKLQKICRKQSRLMHSTQGQGKIRHGASYEKI